MNDAELKQLVEWRHKRGYRGLNLRQDGKAWVVGYGPSSARTSKNFLFTAKFDLQVLWQLDEACRFVEEKCNKIDARFQMFGPSRVSRLRHEMADGNDMEGVLLEKHANGTLRLSFQLHMPSVRYKFTIPKKMHNDDIAIGWCLAFGRQIRALSFDFKTDTLSEEIIRQAWGTFIENLKKSRAA